MRIWLWSEQNQTEVGINPTIVGKIQAGQPDLVIFASDHINLQEPPDITGYQFAGFFEGNLFWKTGTYEQNSYWVIANRSKSLFPHYAIRAFKYLTKKEH